MRGSPRDLLADLQMGEAGALELVEEVTERCRGERYAVQTDSSTPT